MKRAKKIIDNVYWVGVRDLNNRHFHGDLYPIDEGCTYNAYLVVDDEVTLFDTVEEEVTEDMIEVLYLPKAFAAAMGDVAIVAKFTSPARRDEFFKTALRRKDRV